MLLLAALAALAFGSVVWLLRQASRRVMFPTWALPVAPDAPPRGAEVWLRELPGGESVEALFYRTPNPSVQQDQGTGAVIFAHGNAESVDQQTEIVELYHRAGLHVLLPEYRGYGRSGGSPSQAGVVEDFKHFYDRLLESPGVDPDRIVFHGRSLGGAVLAALSRERAPAAMILSSTFTSAGAMARKSGFPEFFVLDQFDTALALRGANWPLLFTHGADDEIVPSQHSDQLHALVTGSRLVLLPGGHNDCPLARGPILHHLRAAGILPP